MLFLFMYELFQLVRDWNPSISILEIQASTPQLR